MKNVLGASLTLVLCAAGCGDDGGAVDTGAPDTGEGELTTTACTFPVTVVTPNRRVFVCNAASPTECEITTTTSSTDFCSDASTPDWSFALDGDTGSLEAPGWMITGFDAGTAGPGASTLMDIPDATPVTCIIIDEGVDYDLAFEFDLAAQSVTISTFAARS